MTDPAILFVKPGAIKDHQKAKLTKAGIIVVEVDNPDDVKFVHASSAAPVQELSHGELLNAATKAINKSIDGACRGYFSTFIAEAVQARHGRPAT